MLAAQMSSARAEQAGAHWLNSGSHWQSLMAEQSDSERPPAEHRRMLGENSGI